MSTMKYKAVFADPENVPLSAMKVGEIGVLLEVPDGKSRQWNGRLVHWSAGHPEGTVLCEIQNSCYWSGVELSNKESQRGYRVRILASGDKIVADGIAEGGFRVEWTPRKPATIPFSALRYGDIAEIVSGSCGHQGELVARVCPPTGIIGEDDISIQRIDGSDRWNNVSRIDPRTQIQVRVLGPRDRIVRVDGDQE